MNTVAQSVYVYFSLIGGAYALWLVCGRCRRTSTTDDRRAKSPARAFNSKFLERACEIAVALVFLVFASATLIAIGRQYSPNVAREHSPGRQTSIQTAGMQAVPSGRLCYASDRQGCPLIGADLSGLPVCDEDVLALLHHSGELEWLILQHTDISDECLPAIGQLSHLSNLNLAHTRITNAGLRHLTPLQELEDLTLSGTSIDDRGLADISSLKSVRSLSLQSTGVTDASLASLSSLHLLRELCATDTKMSPAAMARLAKQLPGLACYYGASCGRKAPSDAD